MFNRVRQFLSGEGKVKIKPEESAASVPEGPNPQFKMGSEAWLVARDIPICSWMGSREVRLRPAREVAERALVLQAIGETSSVGVAEVFGSKESLEWIRKTGIEHALTPIEREYLENERSSQRELEMGWRCEAAWALAWALDWGEDIGDFQQGVHYEFFEQTVQQPDGKRFLTDPHLRSTEEIGQAEDLIVRIHWAFRNAALTGGEQPWMDEFSLDVVMERHHAFAWLVDPDTSWDEVMLDT